MSLRISDNIGIGLLLTDKFGSMGLTAEDKNKLV